MAPSTTVVDTEPHAASAALRGTVSLIMPTFRRIHCIGETVRQLLDAQTRAPLELIVVNNDPAPDAEAALRSALPSDARIRITTCTKGRQGTCRNHGLLMATGDYVAFVDDDDDYSPEFIARLAGALDMGVRSVRCQMQTCGCAGPDCTGRPTRAHHALTQNTMARRSVLTPTWNDPPNEDRDYWFRHPVEGAIDDCLVTNCYGHGQHSPRNAAEGGSWRVRFVITMLVESRDTRCIKAGIAALQSQTYKHFSCIMLDQSGDAGTAAVLSRVGPADARFSVLQPAAPCVDALRRATANGAHQLNADDVLMVLHANERLAHSGVLNRLAHVYAEQDEVWMTYGGCVTEPFTPAWPQASFPPEYWETRRFPNVPTLIGEYAPLTLRASFVHTLHDVLAVTDTAPPAGSSIDADERDLSLFLAAIEASGAAHAYPMAEVQVIKNLEKKQYRDTERRRVAQAQQFEIRARPAISPITKLREVTAISQTTPAPIAWFGSVYDPSGYANELRGFVLSLDDRATPMALRAGGHHSEKFRAAVGADARGRLDALLARPIARGFIGVIHLPPSFLQRIAGAGYMIGRTMFETDGLPPDFVDRCNLMDEVWVPSAFNEDTFKAAGVRSRIVRVPGAVDSERFRPGYDPLPINGARGTVFLSTIEWKTRKGWQTLVLAWADAFAPTDDVTLVFRSSIPDRTEADCAPEILRQIDELLAAHGRRRAQLAPIVVMGRQVADEDVPRLYAAADVYVTPSSGEGWGYPYMEAMASGILTIATRWSGNLEFMNDDNSLLCEIDGLIPAIDEYIAPMPGQLWAKPSASHLSALLRVVVDDPARAARLAARGREDMRSLWTWERSAEIVAQRLAAIAHEHAPVAVNWEGPVFTHSSLGLVNRELGAALITRGVDLALLPSEADDFQPSPAGAYADVARRVTHSPRRPAAVHVAHRWPPRLVAPDAGAWVLMQPWEYGGLPGEWIPIIRDQVDEFWVYCNWQRECAIESGIPAEKVVVVPIGVDPARHRPDGHRFPLKTKKRTKLLAVGGIIPRKGMDLLVETYLRTFTTADDVCLVIKGLSARWAYNGNPAQREYAHLPALSRTKGGAEIEFIGDTLDDDSVASLYRACDALVAPFRGEGFGLPIAEAMATGLPVIVTEAGPVFDICDEQSAFLVPAGQSTPDPRITALEPGRLGYWWADPDVKELARLMRYVVQHPDAAREVGARGRTRILQRFTYAHGAEIAAARLRELAGRTPVRELAPAAFTASAPAFPLDQPRQVVFLHQPSWRAESWKDVVRGFMRGFRQEHDVSLVLTLDPVQGFSSERVAEALMALRAEVSCADEDAPDILLVTEDLDDVTLASLVQAAGGVVVTSADVAGRSRAMAVGKPVISDFSVSAWHAAAHRIAGDAWQVSEVLSSA
ncbi:MAG: glycosyltransferase [Gemmatimonadaceae bacterium]|nr:glycosyltransferase [Gemmatimonadaceae bacterium]